MNNVIVSPSVIRGLGVFATRDLSPGEIILFIDDSRVVDDEHPLRPECGEYDYHCDYLAGGKVVLMAPPERYINSSCDPNSYVRWENGKRCVIARRAIGNGEEITYDYIIDCHGGKCWKCRCGSVSCRGWIVSSFFELPIELQKEYLPLLSGWFIEEHRESVDKLKKQMTA